LLTIPSRKAPSRAAAEQIEPRSGERTIAVASNSLHLERPAASSSAKANDARDLVFTFYQETWADAVGYAMYMSGPRLLATLMSEPSVRRILVANSYRSTPIQWARRLSGQRPVPFPADVRRALVQPRRLRRRDPTSVRALERAYDAYDRILEGAAAKLGADRPTVITTNPFVAGFSPLRWAGRVTFYAWDDWPSGPTFRRWRPAYEEAFARIRDSGRAVVGVSQAILDRIRPTGARAVVPNGVEPEEWRHPGEPPAWFTELRSPRILYVGVLTDRLDIEAISEIAARFSRGSLVLLGPVDDWAVVDPLRRHSNVRIQPPVGRAEVASVIHAADICVMPHRNNQLTTAMSPLKLYEYLAGGRPVAASDLPPVRAVDRRILCVPEGHSFADGVEEALNSGPLTEDERLAFIDANSWSRRHEQILRVAFGPTAAE
jgi:glycosyltransferase involved in cell wall biosynthesis